MNQALATSWIASTGEFLERFETEFAELCGTRHALAVSNGTVALHLALLGLGVGPGDEVIVPSLTYIASVNAITYVGATPVFVDVDPSTWCLDPDRWPPPSPIALKRSWPYISTVSQPTWMH